MSKLESSSSETVRMVYVAIGVCFAWTLCVALTYFLKFRKHSFATSPEAWGQFGDYFAGLLNPIFGLVSLIVLALTIRSQSLAARRTAFENQFFALLQLHSANLMSIDLSYRNGAIVKVGRDCIKTFYDETRKFSREQNVTLQIAYDLETTERRGWELEPYFRSVYHLFKFVRDMGKTAELSTNAQKRYFDLIKVQLSRYELALLYFNFRSSSGGRWNEIVDLPDANPFEHLDVNLVDP
jgi:uncharacterized membrane protein